MKKLIFISLIGLMFTSCGYAPIDNSRPIVINLIERYNKTHCLYYFQGNKMIVNPFSFSDNNTFVLDSCGKYNIGDTIKLN